jgi:hypothetical protein
MGERKNKMYISYISYEHEKALARSRNDLGTEFYRISNDLEEKTKGRSPKYLDRKEMFALMDRFLDLYRRLPVKFPDKRDFLFSCMKKIFRGSQDFQHSTHQSCQFISHSPDYAWNQWQNVCGCEELFHTPFHAMHFTLIPCKDATYAICIPYHTGIMEAHRIGECPHSRYKVVGNE